MGDVSVTDKACASWHVRQSQRELRPTCANDSTQSQPRPDSEGVPPAPYRAPTAAAAAPGRRDAAAASSAKPVARTHVSMDAEAIEHGDSEMCVNTYAAISKANYGTRDHEFEGSENHFVLVAEKAAE